MKTKIPERLWQETGGLDTWKSFGITDGREFGWQKYVEIDLAQITVPRLERLVEMVSPYSSIKGATLMIKDIKIWLRAARKDNSVTPRSVEQFASLLKAALLLYPRHHLYRRELNSDVWRPYYVESITYHPPRTDRDYRRPPMVAVDLFWVEFGKRCKTTVDWCAEDCLGKTVEAALAKLNFYLETEEMRADYLRDVARWEALVGQIGLQLRATGVGTDDLDSADNNTANWKRYNRNTIELDHGGQPAHLLVDVFQETDEKEHKYDNHIDVYFWSRSVIKLLESDEDGEDDSAEDLNSITHRGRRREELPDEQVHDPAEPEVPIHTVLACFDLRRHRRLRVHVGYVEVYTYDKTLASKLVLPPTHISLIEMLITSKGVFRDIVKGKGGGSVVLCCGKPGVGKTLTAEVYSESMERPLYSVQCSQLGLTPKDLEGQLMCVFSRAQRWNAILLLDEADVYISERGNDLLQNAIVGVFLRVLEYYSGTLFLTTNRIGLVDDAIASRCIARIDYRMPPKQDQVRLWSILSSTAGVSILPAVINQAVQTHPHLSGRDIKNIIKLASMMSASTNQPITNDLIDFVSKFRPTFEQTEDVQKDPQA